MPLMARIDPFASPTPKMSSRLESLFEDSSPDFGPRTVEAHRVRPIGDTASQFRDMTPATASTFRDVTPVMPQSSFRERSNRVRQIEEDKNTLIDDLIRQLESSQQQLQQLQLDHEQESRYKRDGQLRENALHEEMAAMRNLLDRNAYISILIDGDHLMFTRDVVSKGEKGGTEAAQLISDTVKKFALSSLPHLERMSVHVKMFANTKALAETFTRFKVVDKTDAFDNFLRGLFESDLVFDFVDTSLVKGLNNRKIKESYRHDFLNVHCQQIFLAALANDDLESLLDEYPDIPVHERVTLLEARNLASNEKFSHEIQSLKAETLFVKLPSETSMKPPQTKIAAPVLARVESNSSSATKNSNQASVASTPVLTWAAMTAMPFVPRPGETRSGNSTPFSVNTPPLPRATTVQTVPRNKFGERVDPVDTTIPYQELQRIKKMKLCNIYYLQGRNACGGECNHSHTYPLKTHEKNILKEVARMTPCMYQLECDDPDCIYGHRCPQSKPGKKDCFYKDSCRFIGWGHGIDEKVVRTQNIR